MKDKRLSVVVVDDDPQTLNITKEKLLLFDSVKRVEKAENFSQFIDIMKRTTADIIFLDIELQDSTGFEMADYIKSYYPNTPYVFLTGHADFALKGYDYSPLDFLTKPVNPIRLKKTLDKVAPQSGPSEVGIMTKGGFELVEIGQITHIEKTGRKNFVHRLNAEPYETSYTLSALEEMFIERGFYQCHKSYMVSLKHIAGIEPEGYTYMIKLKDGRTHIPLSRDRFAELKAMLSDSGIPFI